VTIEVTGGSAGFEVDLAQLASAAFHLTEWAHEVGRVLGVVGATAADPDILATGPLSPATAVRVEAELLRAAGPWGLAGDEAALLALAAATLSAVSAYQAGESAVRAGIEAGQDAGMLMVGRNALPLAAVGVALRGAGVDVGAQADAMVFSAPWVAELAGGAEGLVAGLALDPVTGPLLVAAGLEADDLFPRTFEQALASMAMAGARPGLLQERVAVRVRREPQPHDGAHAARDLAGLVADLDNLSDGEAYPARVRVVEVPAPDGGSVWVVEVPGTQAWQLRAGPNPFDVTADLHQMAHQTTAAALGVERALAAARLEARNLTGRDTTGEPVMLVGHSLGGIVAAGLAADAGFQRRHHATHVVTAGAPIARIPVPDNVAVLSLEHRQDPVPRLEGVANAAGHNWITVTRDVSGDPAARKSPSGAHAASLYRATATAADASQSPSLQAWRTDSAAFFPSAGAPQPIIRDYRIDRLQP
jgi:hypothetical protein